MKKLLAIFGVLILLLLLVIVLLPFLIDLNAFQAQYLPLVEESLNRKVALKDMRVTILPRIGIHINGFTVMDDPLFSSGQFATLESLDLGLKLQPLLSRRIEINEIIIRNPTIAIIKSPIGFMNVSTLGKRTAVTPKEPPLPRPPKEPLQILSLLAVDRLTLSNGQVTYTDRSSGKPVEYQVQKLQLLLQGVGLGLTPVLHSNAVLQPMNLPVKVDGTLGPLQENLDVGVFIFDIAVGKAVFEVKGSAIGATMRFALSSPGISTRDIPVALPLTRPLEFKNIQMAGETKDSQINLGTLDLIIPLGKDNVSVKGSLVGGDVKVKLTAAAINSAEIPLALPFQKPVEISELKANAELKSAHAAIQSLSFKVFGGDVRGQGNAILGTQPLPFNGQLVAEGLQLGPALDALGTNKVSVSGTAKTDLAVQGKGLTAADLTSGLEGTGHALVKDGKLEGINLLKEAAALLKVIGVGQDTGNATVFSRIESDLSVQRGIVTIDRLRLNSRDMDATGSGTIGFDKTLNVKLTVSLSEALSKGLAGTSPVAKAVMSRGRLLVPMIITGSTAAPTYSLDTAVLGAKVQEQVKTKLGEVLKEKSGEEALKKGEEALKKLFGR